MQKTINKYFLSTICLLFVHFVNGQDKIPLHYQADSVLKQYYRPNTDSVIAYGDFCMHCNNRIEKLSVVYKMRRHYLMDVYTSDDLGNVSLITDTLKSGNFYYGFCNNEVKSIKKVLFLGEKVFYDTTYTGKNQYAVSETISDGKMKFFYFRFGSTIMSGSFCCGIFSNDLYRCSKPLWMLASAFNNRDE